MDTTEPAPKDPFLPDPPAPPMAPPPPPPLATKPTTLAKRITSKLIPNEVLSDSDSEPDPELTEEALLADSPKKSTNSIQNWVNQSETITTNVVDKKVQTSSRLKYIY